MFSVSETKIRYSDDNKIYSNRCIVIINMNVIILDDSVWDSPTWIVLNRTGIVLDADDDIRLAVNKVKEKISDLCTYN